MKAKTNRRAGFTLQEIMAVAAVIALFAAIAVPSIVKVREKEQLDGIISNLRAIEAAKEQWALDKKKIGGKPLASELAPYMKYKTFPPAFVVGETYDCNPLGTKATAKLPVKLGSYRAGGIVTLP